MTTTLLRLVADLELSLASQVLAGAATAALNDDEDGDGVALPAGKYGFTIDLGESSKEYIVCDLNGTALTNIVSISKQGAATSGFSQYHRAGATVTITDWAILKRILDNLTGVTGFDSGANLGYDSAPVGLTGNNFATVNYVLSVVAGGAVSFDQQVAGGQVLGETISVNDIVYFKESDQRWWKADADLTATFVQVKLGIAKSAGTAGSAATIAISGPVSGFSMLTPGSKYYLSNTAGGISTSAGTNAVFIGWALSATVLLLDANRIYVPSATEKDAMAGSGSLGTPSTSNKFMTQNGLSSVLKYGGSGVDGALTITSGTTTIDLASAKVVIKNYTTIAITGTGALAFSNPHANGTIIILKCQGNCTITSSANPTIDLRSLGAAAGAATAVGNTGTTSLGVKVGGGAAGTTSGGGNVFGVGGTSPFAYAFELISIVGKLVGFGVGGGGGGGGTSVLNSSEAGGGAGGANLFSGGNSGQGTGGGGAGGGGTGGAGGRGGGALYLEVGGALNITSVINASGANGSSATNKGGGGGGGAGGTIVIVYGTLTANTATLTVAGGTGGTTGDSRNGGDGAAGASLVVANTEFV